MNFYPHHIGDFVSDTIHLSPLEECFYRRALDYCYLHEKPLPKETQQVMRRLRAITQEETQAVEAVLLDFFEERDDGFYNPRVERELAEYAKKAEASRQNGKKGGRPPKNKPKPNQNETEEEPKENPPETQQVILGSENKTQNNLNQEPITNNQYIYIKDASKSEDQNHTLKVLHDRGVTGDVAEKYLAVRDLKRCTLMTEAQAEDSLAEAKKAGLTLTDALAYCTNKLPNPWAEFKADWYAKAEGITLTASAYGNKTPEQVLAEAAAEREANAVPPRNGPPPGKLMDTLKAAQAEKAGA